jgi:hypothetical protein
MKKVLSGGLALTLPHSSQFNRDLIWCASSNLPTADSYPTREKPAAALCMQNERCLNAKRELGLRKN